jgi:hypothetical protein
MAVTISQWRGYRGDQLTEKIDISSLRTSIANGITQVRFCFLPQAQKLPKQGVRRGPPAPSGFAVT